MLGPKMCPLRSATGNDDVISRGNYVVITKLLAILDPPSRTYNFTNCTPTCTRECNWQNSSVKCSDFSLTIYFVE